MSPIMTILATTTINPRPITVLLKALQLIDSLYRQFVPLQRHFRMTYELRWFENVDDGIIFFYNIFLYKNNNKKQQGSLQWFKSDAIGSKLRNF